MDNTPLLEIGFDGHYVVYLWGKGWENASCLKSKAGLPLVGSLVFLLEERRQKMRKLAVFLCAMVLVLGAIGNVNAELIDRGGGLIYDDVLDITWLQDANYAKTSGYQLDLNGQMSWDQAVAWAEGLDYYDPVRNKVWSDWRLPHTLPVDGSNIEPVYEWISHGNRYPKDGSEDRGFNVSAPGSAYPGSTGSEMAFMFYNNFRHRYLEAKN